ncbi:MAG: NHL repeat-containing protein [Planctomycetota bacterium]|jgi:hypothetical protein
MRAWKSLASIFAALSFLVLCCFVSGCGAPEYVEEEPIFYPSPPDIPRVQFLKFYSGPKDIGKKRKSGGLEAFVLGDSQGPDVRTDIRKPYGVEIYENKLYVCDLDAAMVKVLDLQTGLFQPMTQDRRMVNPASIAIDNGVKYVADPGTGAVYVFNRGNEMISIFGKDMKMMPVDVVVQGNYCYVLDGNSSQVVVLDKGTGEEVKRLGKYGDELGNLKYVTCLGVDAEENVYVSDKIKGHITKLNKDGIFQLNIGRLGDSILHFTRVKGVDIDREGRIWCIDAGRAVVKAYSPEGRLLIAFGYSDGRGGSLYLPAKIKIDYDNVQHFQQHAVEGAELEFLIVVTNQFGPYKVNVYGFGKFPEQIKALEEKKKASVEEIKSNE